MNTRSAKTINLFDMTDKQQALVAECLVGLTAIKKSKMPIIIPKSIIHRVNGVSFKLSHQILYLPKTNQYLIYMGEVIGKGTYGEVTKLMHELKITDSKIEVINNTEYAVKVGNENSSESFQKEYQFGSQMRYLGMSQVGGIQNLLLMKLLPGTNLHNKIHDNKNKIIEIEQLIDISLKLLYQLKEQVHQRNIIHYDLKPLNIIIRDKGSDRQYPYSLRLLDFGLSRTKDDNANLYETAYIYAPPELYVYGEMKADPKHDAYSAGITLAELWGHRLTGDDIKSGALHTLALSVLGSNSSIPEDVKNLIKSIIANLISKKISERFPIEQAIEEFHFVRMRLAQVLENFYLSVIDANELAQKTRERLRETDISVALMKDNIEMALNDIEDNEYALAEFQYVTNIKIFHGLKTKKDFIKKMEYICSEYEKTEHLVDFLKKYMEKELAIDKRAKLDNMHRSNEKIKEQIENDPYLKKLEKIHQIRTGLKKFSKEKGLRANIATEVMNYIDKTLSTSTIKNRDRAASARRINDMDYILRALEAIVDDKELSELLQRRFKSPEFTTGFFGRSSLRDGVLKAIEAKEIPAKRPRG